MESSRIHLTESRAGYGGVLVEFVLEGPPVSLNALIRGKKLALKHYRGWERKVKEAARNAMPTNASPTLRDDIVVTVTCFHTAFRTDVDNVLKPILDAMEKVVYDDDKQVQRVIGRRI